MTGEISKAEEKYLNPTPAAGGFEFPLDEVSGGPGSRWTFAELVIVVNAYLDMLEMEIEGRKYVKKHIKEGIMPLLNGRRSIDHRLQNITAVMMGMGMPWVKGYAPLAGQRRPDLEWAVEHCLEERGWRIEAAAERSLANAESSPREIQIKTADAAFADMEKSTRLSPADRAVLLARAWKSDAAKRDERNRKIGKAGEILVMASEKARLQNAGLPQLADLVEHSSKFRGDGLGFDVASRNADGSVRFLEVKTTGGYAETPFFMSRKEREKSRIITADGCDWRLVRVHDFYNDPGAFEMTWMQLEKYGKFESRNFAVSLSRDFDVHEASMAIA